jgi:signal transduction histidine kinase
VQVIAWTVVFFLVLYGVLFYCFTGVHVVLLGYIATSIAAPFALTIFRRTRTLRTCINYLLALALVSLVNAICFTGGLDSPALIWLVVVPLVGGHLIPPRDKLTWGAICIGCFIAVYLAKLGELDLPSVIPAWFMPTYWFLTYLSAALGSLVCIAFFDHDMQHLIDESVLQEGRIRTLLRALLHDLANPLTAIKGAHDLLIDQAPDQPVNRKYLSAMGRGIARMDEILTRIRQLEQARAGKIQVPVQPVKLLGALEAALAGVQAMAEAKRIQFRVHQTAAATVEVMADRVTLINQVITNLLTNAIKFSSDGGFIDISVRELDDEVELEIRDHGVGIPRELVAEFERSGQLQSRPGTQGEKGTGFGMPIVKSFVSYFGGTMRLDSRVEAPGARDHGTAITIRLGRVRQGQALASGEAAA